jgi:hypothetical protein
METECDRQTRREAALRLAAGVTQTHEVCSFIRR